MQIKDIRADHYRIPLPVVLSDSTHGSIPAFELITVRVRDADGAEGVGYTYTVGAGGAVGVGAAERRGSRSATVGPLGTGSA